MLLLIFFLFSAITQRHELLERVLEILVECIVKEEVQTDGANEENVGDLGEK
jgi:hypothetical protein